MENFYRQAGSVVPSQRQLDWFDTEFYGFVHFSPNTYTGLEWGLGNEDPAIFNPVNLDCDAWVEAFRSAGLKGMILTAKHHDGFCLWQTETTDHSIKSSPFMGGKGDIVAAAAEACRRGGLKFGVYLSPWDRNCPLYGSDAYNDYYKAQLTELLTHYGELFMVWFDGACGEGPNGRRQEYDFPGYIELVRKYQPKAAIFGEYGDIRWIGNEAGTTRNAEWSVLPGEYSSGSLPPVQTGPGPLAVPHPYASVTDPDLGSTERIFATEKGLIFKPAEVDMSIRPGWFYHPEEEPHSLERLFDTYIRTIGGNACFHLNVPPTPAGIFDPRDVARLKELGNTIQEAFSHPIPGDITCLSESRDGALYRINFPEKAKLRYIILEEDLPKGQRVASFALRSPEGAAFFHGTTIGHKRICPVSYEGTSLLVEITFSRDTPLLKKITLFA